MNNTKRIAIYIDRKNFNKNYKSEGYKLNTNKFIPLSVWSQLNAKILEQYKKMSNEESPISILDNLDIQHQGTWLFVSERSDFLSTSHNIPNRAVNKEKRFLNFMKTVDSLHGFNIKYGTRAGFDKEEKIKGVDINIVCHMMHGAFQDHYDAAILVSDNEEFVPAVEMVQDEFGKQVYHMGFKPDRLRATCFGNLPLEAEGGASWLID